MPVGIRLRKSVKSKPRVPLARRSREANGIESIRRRKDENGEIREGQLHVYGDGDATGRERKRSNPKGRYTSEAKVRNFNEDYPRLDRGSEERSPRLGVKSGKKDGFYKRKGSVYKESDGIKSYRRRKDENGDIKEGQLHVYGDGDTIGREKRRSNPKGRYTSGAKVRNFDEDDPCLDRRSEERSPRLREKSGNDAVYKRKGSVYKEANAIKSYRRRKDENGEIREGQLHVYGDGDTIGRENRRSNPKGRYNSEAKVRNFNEDRPRLDRGSEERSPRLRVNAGKDAVYKRKGSDRTDRGTNAERSHGKFDLKERNDVEASNTRFSLKRKKVEEDIYDDNRMGYSKHRAEEKQVNEEKVDQNSEQKYRRLPSRVLDKTGKKIRVNRKALEDGSAGLRKKKKRTIKIDPYDISNKRLDDSVILNDTVEEEKNEISMNAQFRAILPSPEILSFVEDNLIGRRRLIELQNAGYNVKLSAPLDNNPFSTSPEREKIEESIFRNKLEFFAAAKISSSFPPPLIPEIAFAGRSNVGKSSLLNTLTRQWGVARTSDKPGLTQTINFFSLASKLCLVDLPGYGFAYAKEEVKESWEELVKEYVSTRVGLQRVCLLVDTKWGMKPRDHELIDLMERSQTPYQIVLTKTDIVFPIDVARRALQIQENLKSNKSLVNPVMMVSSKSGAGIHSLRTVLAKLSRFIKP